LQRRFEQAIVEGVYTRGERLGAVDLADRFEVALDRIAAVLDAALRKGLVERVPVGGDAYRVLGLVESRFSSVFTHTNESGLRPRSEVRLVEVEPAANIVAEKLEVTVGAPVYRYVRTRYVDEEALANQTNYIPYEVCPGLEGDDVSHYSFQKLLEGKYHAVLTGMEEAFNIAPANDEDQQILGLPAEASVLLIERIVRSATGWPLVWASIRIRPDRYQYVAALWPKAAALLR
jgi:GntR family transcriptional regulator